MNGDGVLVRGEKWMICARESGVSGVLVREVS